MGVRNSADSIIIKSNSVSSIQIIPTKSKKELDRANTKSIV